MRAVARAGEFLHRKRAIDTLFSSCIEHLSHENWGPDFSFSAEVDPLASVCYHNDQESEHRRILASGGRGHDRLFQRSYFWAPQGGTLVTNMEAPSEGGTRVLPGESTEILVEMDSVPEKVSVHSSQTQVESTVIDRIAGEDVRIDLVSGISAGSVGQEVVSSAEAEGTNELLDGSVADDASLAKRLKVEAALPHVGRAWEHWNKLGAPKLMVAPMVDQSELPFRMLCRKYGATAAYSPMLHSRLFAQDVKYRTKEFSTCPEDRPLFIQFCANNPDTLLEAAKFVQDDCDYVDINFGCPQRIAKRGNYGAFLMDDLPLVRSLVAKLATGLTTPVSCKIRMFPKLDDTLAYARMLEEAGCCLLAVHGRTRDQKDGKAIRADWSVIKAVKSALRIPVVANGNVRWLEDVDECIRVTGVDGVMSAESLLENPALFAGYRMKALDGEELNGHHALDEPALTLEYLELCERYPVPARMIRAHVHRMLGAWFRRYPELRDELNKEHKITPQWLKGMVHRLRAQHEAATAGTHREEDQGGTSGLVMRPAQAVA